LENALFGLEVITMSKLNSFVDKLKIDSVISFHYDDDDEYSDQFVCILTNIYKSRL